MDEPESAVVYAFNAQWPVGSEVAVITDDGTVHFSQIKSPATLLNEDPVAWLHEFSGAYLLSRVIPINHELHEGGQDGSI